MTGLTLSDLAGRAGRRNAGRSAIIVGFQALDPCHIAATYALTPQSFSDQ
jgi:hypothetical protein